MFHSHSVFNIITFTDIVTYTDIVYHSHSHSVSNIITFTDIVTNTYIVSQKGGEGGLKTQVRVVKHIKQPGLT